MFQAIHLIVMDTKIYLLKAIRAAIEAGNAILKVYHSDIIVEYKNDHSPLTFADKRSHEIILESLKAFDIPVLSEEGKDIPYEKRKKWDMLWVVDPLDGTKEFIKRNGEFTVNIALLKGEKPILGVIFIPAKNTLYFAAEELGAFKLVINFVDIKQDVSLNQIIHQSVPLPLKHRISTARVFTVAGSRSHATPRLRSFVEKKRREHSALEVISIGSSIKFCLVAEGSVDVYPRFGSTMEWDTAAGQAIAENAGAAVIRYDTGVPLIYNKPDLLNPWFIVKRICL